MKGFSCKLVALLLLTVPMISAHAQAEAVSPLSTIRSTVEQARQVLEDPAYQGEERRQQRLEKIKEIVLPKFDAQEIAKRALGVYWKDRTEAQRTEFTQLFTTLVEKTYSHNLDRYRADVEFFYDNERVENDFAQVDTRILEPAQNKTFVVTYFLRKGNEKWLIYDVMIENVSLVRNYRNQFNRILTNKSYEDLVRALQEKIQQLDKMPPSSKRAESSHLRHSQRN